MHYFMPYFMGYQSRTNFAYNTAASRFARQGYAYSACTTRGQHTNFLFSGVYFRISGKINAGFNFCFQIFDADSLKIWTKVENQKRGIFSP